MRILGLSGGYHDSAAALVIDGKVIAAAQEERFSRVKHDSDFPTKATRYCLAEAGLAASDIDAVAWYENPYLKFQRILYGYCAVAPRGYQRFSASLPAWVAHRLWPAREIAQRLGTSCPIRYVRHHRSHAASAYYPSGFENAAILTVDGVGEWATNTIWHGRHGNLTGLYEVHFPHSLGLLYSALTAYCGFKINDGEYKLMGLAASGTPLFADALRDRVIDIAHDGSYKLDLTYFVYQHRDAMLSDRFNDLLGGPPRKKHEPLSQRFADVAASVQIVLEEVLLKQARFAHAVTGASDLCLAGGVALNCVANAKLLKESGFERIWIQPAAGDAGGALGAALTIAAEEGEITPESAHTLQQGSYLGPAFAEAEIESLLKITACSYQRLSPNDLCETVAADLEKGLIVGWFQGRMEFGPRALGNRSILADPRDPAMKSRLNARIKHREAFRPFAPITLETEAGRHFQMCAPSPYMLLVAPVLSSHLPAVTHEDGTARVQTLSAGVNPLMEQLLAAFGRRTGGAVLVNTSFNDADEPIVCTPLDALRTFSATNLDKLALGPFLVSAVDPVLIPPGSTIANPTPITQPLWRSAVTMALFVLVVLPLAIPVRAWNALIRNRKRGSYWVQMG